MPALFVPRLAPLLAAALSLTLAAPVSAEGTARLAWWSDFSGPLPPPDAWNHTVTFFADGKVSVEYCRDHGTSPWTCATEERQLSEAAFAQFQAALAPMAADLAADPPVAIQVPPGGGAVSGGIMGPGGSVTLPAFTVEEDAERVRAALALLQGSTPEGMIEAAAAKAAVASQ